MSTHDDANSAASGLVNEELVELLLSGYDLPLDDQSNYGDLVAVLRAVRAPGENDELNGLPDVVRAFRNTLSPTPARASRPVVGRLLTGKALAAIGAVILTAGAAAATGVVPIPFSPARSHEVASTDAATASTGSVNDQDHDQGLGIVSGAVVDAAKTTTDRTTDLADAEQGGQLAPTGPVVPTDNVPDAHVAAMPELCMAYQAAGHDGSAAWPADSAVGMQSLMSAARAAGQTVQEYCAAASPAATPTSADDAAHSPSVTAPGQVDGSPSVTAPGQVDGSPSVTAPGQVDGSPSVTAPGQVDGSPSVTAPGQVDGSPSVTAPGQVDGSPSVTAPGQVDGSPSVTAPGQVRPRGGSA